MERLEENRLKDIIKNVIKERNFANSVLLCSFVGGLIVLRLCTGDYVESPM